MGLMVLGRVLMLLREVLHLAKSQAHQRQHDLLEHEPARRHRACRRRA